MKFFRWYCLFLVAVIAAAIVLPIANKNLASSAEVETILLYLSTNTQIKGSMGEGDWRISPTPRRVEHMFDGSSNGIYQFSNGSHSVEVRWTRKSISATDIHVTVFSLNKENSGDVIGSANLQTKNDRNSF